MREIKFRLYFAGYEHEPEFYTLAEMIDNSDINGYKHISQYTGRKDKKRTDKYPAGQEIYDNDIVKSISGKIAEIRINECILEWNIYPPYHWRKDNINTFGIMSEGHSSGCEVVGNIFENPELREKTKSYCEEEIENGSR